MEPKYKVNPLTGELQEYVFEYNGILALRNFTARVEDERLILHAADDVNFSILEALVSEVEINGVVYDNPTAAQEALTRLTFNQNRPVLLDKTLKDLILGAVQKVEGKGLSSNDYTNDEKQKNEENALKRVANLTVTGDVNKIITITFADSTVIQAPFKDNDHIPSADVNMNSLNFNINTGVLTGVKNDGNEITVTLDGRYALISHNHDEQYAAKEHTHREYAPTDHTHNFDDIQGKPNNLATTENVKTAVEGIQIGGRNLLLNSGQKITNNNYNIATYFLTEELNVGDLLTITIKGQLGNGKTAFALYDQLGNIEQCALFDKGGGIYQCTFNYKGYHNNSDKMRLTTWTYPSSVDVNSTIEWVKLERGNKATDWTPAVEETINLWKRLLNSPYGETILSNLPIIIREIFLDNTEGSKTNLWTANNELNVGSRNAGGYSKVRSSGYNINGKDDNYIVLAGGSCVHKKDLIGRVIVVKTPTFDITPEVIGHTAHIFATCSLNYNTMPLSSTFAVRKVFDGGEVKFTGGIEAVYTGDKVLNGKKGSTAIIDYGSEENMIFIDIRNI